MFIRSLITAVQDRITARRKYRRAVAEIEALTQSELMDLGVFEVDLYRAARKEIRG